MTDYYFHHLNSIDNTGDVRPLVTGNKINGSDESTQPASSGDEAARRSMVNSAQQAGGYKTDGDA